MITILQYETWFNARLDEIDFIATRKSVFTFTPICQILERLALTVYFDRIKNNTDNKHKDHQVKSKDVKDLISNYLSKIDTNYTTLITSDEFYKQFRCALTHALSLYSDMSLKQNLFCLTHGCPSCHLQKTKTNQVIINAENLLTDVRNLIKLIFADTTLQQNIIDCANEWPPVGAEFIK